MKAVFISFLLLLLSVSINMLVAQDECANAVNIPVQNYSTCGDMAMETIDLTGATHSATTPLPTCANFGATTNDLWYTYTVPAGVTQMSFHMFNSSNSVPFPNASAPGMALYRGTCAALTLIDCFESTPVFMENGEIRWENVTGLVPGETIYMRVWDENNLAQEIFIAASVRTSMQEDNCDTPVPMSDGGCNILSQGGDITAPSLCGWNSTDNSVFYNFTVYAGDPQPYTITVDNGNCWANAGGMLPEDAEIQFAIYQWNGIDCTDIGGAGATYMGCANGTGTVTFSQNLPVGDYILAMDGYSMMSGNSLCIYGFAAPFIPLTPDVLSVSLTTVDNGCGQTGSATITINSSCGGAPTIAWSSSAGTGTTETNLAAGAYSVTVTDNDPTCGDTVINFNIGATATFVVSVTNSGNACSGPVTLTANVMGANPGDCTFDWDDPANSSTQSIIVNTGGTFTCTATYGTCVDTDDITIVDGDFDITVVYNAEICDGGSGSAGVNIITGSGNYIREWSTGSIAAGISFTSGGNYCVTVTDVTYGCQIIECFTVTVNPAISVTIDATDITCKDEDDGTATAIVSGGAPDYEYMWSTFMPVQTLTNLIQGNYAVTVEDANGCTGTASVFIAEPPQFYYTISPPDGICLGEQADINVYVTGGVEPYLYSWEDAPAMNSDSRTVSPLVNTLYTVSVYDANLCTYTAQSTTITVSQPIIIDVVTVDLLCHGVCDGSATLEISGGVPPFDYSWGSTTDYMLNLCAGDYDITLTDQFDCVGSTSFTLTEPDTMYLSTMSGPATCWGYNDGYGEVNVIGGVPFTNATESFYQYLWTGGQSADSVALGFGFYNVSVTDANGCQHVASVFVDQPEAVYVTAPWGGTICIGETFETYVHATGGLGPYDFVWMGSDATTYYGEILTVNPVVTTTYQLITTDSRGCFGPLKNVTVIVNPVIEIISLESSPDAVCIGESINIEMEIQGGNGGPYTILMEDYGIVNMPMTFYPQTTGYYPISVADACGSPGDVDSIFVTVHPLPQVGFMADHTTSCPPGVFQFTETTPDVGQTYLWDFGDGGFSVQKNPLHIYTTTGIYNVDVTAWSEYGCEKTITYNNMIRIYPLPRAEFAATPEVVSVLNAQVEFTNYTEGGFTYFWDFGDGNSSIWTPDMQIHTYTEVGQYDITLIAKNQYECRDTAYKSVRVHDEYSFYAPDAFTPNGDGLNDFFYVIGHGIDKTQFYLVIYDRYGIKVFETRTFDEENPYRMAWDGSHNGSVFKGDDIMTNGMYRWYCTFSDFIGKPHEESGTVTLIR